MTLVESHASFRSELLQAGILTEMGIPGLYARSAVFEQLAQAVARLASESGRGTAAACLYFPPLMNRTDFEQTGYLRSFPDLMGALTTFTGNDADHRELLAAAERGADWTPGMSSSDLVMCSAACHPLYSLLPGDIAAGGQRYELEGFCFRHEPSIDPARMQTFRQHEFVFVGSSEGALAHRDEWLARAEALLASLGLQIQVVEANDPFFGRAGRLLAAGQREAKLKFEIVAPVASTEALTAITSANYHDDHFGAPFGLRQPDGESAHTSCIGFGLERIVLALLAEHGSNPDDWTPPIRSRLAL